MGFGPTHTQVVLTADGPRVIETHLRVGGDEIFNLVKDAVGVDMIDFQTRQAFGEKVLPDIRAVLEADGEPRCEAIWYTAPEASGTYVGLANDVEADDLDPGVTVLLAPGDELSGQGSFARIARARAPAPDAEQALAGARENAAGLSFLFRVTSPEPGTV